MTDDELHQKTLHHVGFVVADIQKEIDAFARSIDANWDGKIHLDPLQKSKVAFLQTERPGAALIELVEPAGADSPVLSFLQKGGGLHHLCYEVAHLEAYLTTMRSAGAVILKPPVPAVAFAGRRIAWAVTRHKLLLEFLEADG